VIVGGRLDILVAHAAMSGSATIEETTVEQFDNLLAVNEHPTKRARSPAISCMWTADRSSDHNVTSRGRSRALLGSEEIRSYQIHLIEVEQRARSTLVVATAALRLLYIVTLKRDWSIDETPLSKVRQPVRAKPSARASPSGLLAIPERSPASDRNSSA
jgi:hypothetical protein